MDLPLPLARAFDRVLGQSLHASQGDLGLLAERAIRLSHPDRGHRRAGSRLMTRSSFIVQSRGVYHADPGPIRVTRLPQEAARGGVGERLTERLGCRGMGRRSDRVLLIA